MLRSCLREASRRGVGGGGGGVRPRSLSSLPSAAPAWDLDDDGDGGGRRRHRHQPHPRRRCGPPAIGAAVRVPRRHLGISRHPDPTNRPEPTISVEDDGYDEDGLPRGGGVGEGFKGGDGYRGGGYAGGSGGKGGSDDDEEDDEAAKLRKAERFWDDDDDDYDGKGDKEDDKSDFSEIFGDLSDLSSPDDEKKGDEDEDPVAAAFHARQARIKDELSSRRGRLWTDEWIITDDEWLTHQTYDEIEEWRPESATRVSAESVRAFEGGVPTLGELSRLALPPSLPSHPGYGKPREWAVHRKRKLKAQLRAAIQAEIHGDLKEALEATSWEEKQRMVDGLYESIEARVKAREPVLGQLPAFGDMCEKGLEDVLQMVQNRMNRAEKKAAKRAEKARQTSSKSDDGDGGGADDPPPARALPKFFSESNKAGVPNLVYPLDVHHKGDGNGRMVEEWELAANKETRRIMMRSCTREIAEKVADATRDVELRKGAARVFVTAALAGIVASARVSGHVVLYLPDGDRLRKHGFYNEPCNHRKGLYNLPMIAQEICDQILTSHGDDVRAMAPVSKEDMKGFLTDDQIGREDVASMTELSLDKILHVGTGSAQLSSGCYGTVIHRLMNQQERPFTVVMDEFNTYYDHGQYFHMDYDFDVFKAIPLNRITLFKPFLDAMGLYPSEAGTKMTDELAVPSAKAMMKWGSMVVATSESRAVKRSFTHSLTDAAHALSGAAKHPVHVVDVHRFSGVEVQHQLYNYEIVGVGRLRHDRGDTALNPEEVQYLKLLSGGSGQQLMDACMLP
ncbi:hypothetical protein ACHAWF_017878 [Thalassiosira exigua]